MTAYTHFVRWERADDFLMLGWLPTDALAGTPHETYSVLMRWCCACKPVVPVKS
jgi:hypothetical protein